MVEGGRRGSGWFQPASSALVIARGFLSGARAGSGAEGQGFECPVWRE